MVLYLLEKVTPTSRGVWSELQNEWSSLLLYLLHNQRGTLFKFTHHLRNEGIQVYVFVHVRWWFGTWWVTCMRSLPFPHHPSTRGRNNDELETLEPSNFTNNQLFKTIMTAFYAAVCGFERLCTTYLQACVCACVCEWVRESLMSINEVGETKTLRS